MKNAFVSLLKVYIASIFLGIFQKVIFLAYYSDLTSEIGLDGILGVFWWGLKLDIATAGYITALPLTALLFASWGGWKISRVVWQRGLFLYLSIIAILLGVISSIDLNLYGYWGYRVDATLIPYLLSPKEAMASVNLFDGMVAVVNLIAVAGLAIYMYHKALLSFEIRPLIPIRRVTTTLALLLAGGFLFLGIRGGVTESVANVSQVYFSANQFANHAAVNPAFSLMSSIARVEKFDEMYAYFNIEDMKREYAKEHAPNPSPEVEKILTTERPNVAIIIWESFTSDIFDMVIDGREVMPQMRKLASESLYFRNNFALGARTDKGVAAVLSAFPAQPKISIMKIPAKSRKLPSIARSLGAEGYESNFYYGGDLNFMDMSSYLYSTGWQALHWLRDYDLPRKERRQWGYSDGAMGEIFADAVIESSKSATPQLNGWLTLSSHEPFDVPIDMGFKDIRFNSMAYSDAQVGATIAKLKASPAWENLIVIIVADHTLGYSQHILNGSPQRQLIPMIWCGGALAKGGEITDYTSQIDIVPSLLSQMGIGHDEYLFGRDIFDTSSERRKYGYSIFSDGFIVTGPDGALIYDNRAKRLSRVKGRIVENGVTKGQNEMVWVHSADSLSQTEREKYDWGRRMLQMTHYHIGEL